MDLEHTKTYILICYMPCVIKRNFHVLSFLVVLVGTLHGQWVVAIPRHSETTCIKTLPVFLGADGIYFEILQGDIYVADTDLQNVSISGFWCTHGYIMTCIMKTKNFTSLHFFFYFVGTLNFNLSPRKQNKNRPQGFKYLLVYYIILMMGKNAKMGCDQLATICCTVEVCIPQYGFINKEACIFLELIRICCKIICTVIVKYCVQSNFGDFFSILSPYMAMILNTHHIQTKWNILKPVWGFFIGFI